MRTGVEDAARSVGYTLRVGRAGIPERQARYG